MEPHSHIAHNRKQHIDFYVIPIAIGTMFLCYYVVEKNWLLHPDSHLIIQNNEWIKNYWV